MADRLTRTLAVAIVVLLAALVAQPYVDRWLAPPAPAVVVPRADLSDLERASVELFQSVAPSVVQVAATPRGADPRSGETQTGTGFVWDADGHVVTNAHVVANATNVVVRLASGDTVAAEVIGRAPTYDLPCCGWRSGQRCHRRSGSARPTRSRSGNSPTRSATRSVSTSR